MKALVVVAHDDDVVLWMGGVVHHLHDWNWHLVSMCNQGNIERRGYFEETSRRLNARSSALDFGDYQEISKASSPNSVSRMKQDLLKIVEDQTYDFLFTHSRDPNGEYSPHHNHYEVCCVVRSLVSEGRLIDQANRLAYFCYSPIYPVKVLATVARQDAKYYYQLSYEDLSIKVELIRSHLKPIIDNLEQCLGAPCPNPEAFEGDNLILPLPFRERDFVI